jgi:hypothetical protein
LVRAQVGPLSKSQSTYRNVGAFFVDFPYETNCSSLQKGGNFFITDNLKNYSNIRHLNFFLLCA